jgi:hypothetical protein
MRRKVGLTAVVRSGVLGCIAGGPKSKRISLKESGRKRSRLASTSMFRINCTRCAQQFVSLYKPALRVSCPWSIPRAAMCSSDALLLLTFQRAKLHFGAKISGLPGLITTGSTF